MQHWYVRSGIWIGIGLFLLLLLSLIAPIPCARGCNVILIMADTLSAKHMDAYGYERETMPETAAFFKKGVVFDNASANSPWTLPSFTSLYFSDIASRVTYADLDGTRPNMIRTLRESGVRIQAIGPGFDNFIFDGITRVYAPGEAEGTNYGSPFAKAGEKVKALNDAGEPFFLLVHTFQPHDPYKPSEPFNAYYEETNEYPAVSMQDLLAEYTERTPDPHRVARYELRYDQQLAQTDKDIASFLYGIPEETLKNTVVILSSDHGEAFNERGFLFHANSLFEEELHIPLMMRIPGAGPRRVTEPVSLLDIAPTVLDLQGVAIPERFTGTSLLPLIRGGALRERTIPLVNGRPFFLAWVPGQSPFFASLEAAKASGSMHAIIEPASFGVRSGNHKFFMQKYPPQNEGLHWYDLSKDPEEKNNLTNVLTPPAHLLEAMDAFEKAVP